MKFLPGNSPSKNLPFEIEKTRIFTWVLLKIFRCLEFYRSLFLSCKGEFFFGNFPCQCFYFLQIASVFLNLVFKICFQIFHSHSQKISLNIATNWQKYHKIWFHWYLDLFKIYQRSMPMTFSRFVAQWQVQATPQAKPKSKHRRRKIFSPAAASCLQRAELSNK